MRACVCILCVRMYARMCCEGKERNSQTLRVRVSHPQFPRSVCVVYDRVMTAHSHVPRVSLQLSRVFSDRLIPFSFTSWE